MPDYRIFHMSHEGQIKDAAVIVCRSIEELKDFILHYLISDRNIEVWSGADMVYKSPDFFLHRNLAASLTSRSALKESDDVSPLP